MVKMAQTYLKKKNSAENWIYKNNQKITSWKKNLPLGYFSRSYINLKGHLRSFLENEYKVEVLKQLFCFVFYFWYAA